MILEEVEEVLNPKIFDFETVRRFAENYLT